MMIGVLDVNYGTQHYSDRPYYNTLTPKALIDNTLPAPSIYDLVYGILYDMIDEEPSLRVPQLHENLVPVTNRGAKFTWYWPLCRLCLRWKRNESGSDHPHKPLKLPPNNYNLSGVVRSNSLGRLLHRCFSRISSLSGKLRTYHHGQRRG